MVLLCAISYLLITIAAAATAVMRQRDPYKALLWVLAIISLPVIGLLLYLLTGLRRQCGAPATHRRNGSAVQTIIRSCCGEPVTAYNRLTQLHNADNAYSALISEIQRARRSIHLEYYIFNDDRLGRTLINLLCRKSRAGVEVRIIYDAIGSWRLGRRSISRMRRAGIGIRGFRPLRFPWFRSGVARRNHRKIAVIDGTTAFVGGINIAKRYIDGNRLGKWRDEHLQLEGDIVGRLQRLFAADWQKVGGEAGDVLRHMPGHRIRSRLPVQIAWNDDGSACATLHDAFTAAIMRADRSIRISTPYFIPPRTLADAIRMAAESGVMVEIMVPERGDSAVTTAASDSFVREMHEAGATIHRYTDGFLHSKLLIVDDSLATVGAANMDYRSLEDNLEVTAFIYDRRSVSLMAERFEADKESCRTIPAGVNAGAGPLRLAAERLARLLAPLL